MKKELYFVALMCMLMACSKDDAVRNETTNTKNVLKAELSQPVNEETKSALSGLNVVWSEKDKIAVFADKATEFKKYTLNDESKGSTSGEFSGEAVEAAYAYYPYETVVSIDGSNNVSVFIPRVQTYSSSSFGLGDMPMIATVKGTTLKFKNLMAVLKLPMTGTGVVSKVVVFSEEQKMSGMATIAPDGAITFSSTVGKANNWVELDCGSGVDLSTNPTFYIAVPAGNYKFSVRVISKDSKVAPDKSTKSAKSFTANRIKPMESFDVVFGEKIVYADGVYIGSPIDIKGKLWAPVNCGYDGSFKNGKYGKFFQSGRKYGQTAGITVTPTREERSISDGSNPLNEYKYYSATYNLNGTWSPTTVHYSSTKGATDPCPAGWRVPTVDEFKELVMYGTVHHTVINNDIRMHPMNDAGDTVYGLWFDGNTDPSNINPNPAKVTALFLPAAGFRIRRDGTCPLISSTSQIIYGTAPSWNCVSVSFTLVGGEYKETYGDAVQNQAQAFPIRCIKIKEK